MTHAPTTPARAALVTLAAAGGIFAHADAAHAQTPGEVIIEVADPVLAPGESTAVRLWAAFDGFRGFALASLYTSLLADAGGADLSLLWSDVALVPPLNGPGMTAGVPESGGYSGISVWQFHDPLDPRYTDPSNPIAFWSGTFTAPADAMPFTVNLSSLTSRFDVYVSIDSITSESRLAGLTEGAATITVIPAPASGVVLLGLVALRRRR